MESLWTLTAIGALTISLSSPLAFTLAMSIILITVFTHAYITYN